ncbi:unnamed protein product [Nesidiocoris tenuis]|uniref:Uncharacterized protein n=1 Tax=Nesidiocoris tenuis TaxID=355587 RepID=A0A6H5GTA6_9HEMI|nr:unnamed protein product [Nesidiocoris tenuis]
MAAQPGGMIGGEPLGNYQGGIQFAPTSFNIHPTRTTRGWKSRRRKMNSIRVLNSWAK